MRRASLACGLVLIALGALAVTEALRIRDEWPGARLMPAVIGVALLALGAGHVVRPASPAGGERWPDRHGWRRVGFVLGLLVLYVGALPWLGFLPATAVFVLALLRFIGTFAWPTALALTAVIALASHVVFKHWLGMPLPAGLFGV